MATQIIGELKEYNAAVNTSRPSTGFIDLATYDNVENCPHGELPEKTCSDDKWECKLCKPGFYLDSNDNLCKPNANFGPSLLSSCCSLLCCLPLFIYIFILIREWWERRSARNEALGTMSGIAYGRQKYNYNPNLAISP